MEKVSADQKLKLIQMKLPQKNLKLPLLKELLTNISKMQIKHLILASGNVINSLLMVKKYKTLWDYLFMQYSSLKLMKTALL